MMDTTMRNDDWGEPGSGARKLRSRQRQRQVIKLTALLVLLTSLFLLWSQDRLPTSAATIPPGMAIGMGIGLLAGAAAGYRIFHKMNDEHDVRARRVAGQTAFMVLLFGWPAWALFAIGKLLPPVNDYIVYGTGLAIYAVTFLWQKYR